MPHNNTKFMESAIALSEELNFTRAAQKIHMSQPTLTRNIAELEHDLGFRVFVRDRKNVKLNDAGRAYVEQARLALLYGERAFQAARAVMQDADMQLARKRKVTPSKIQHITAPEEAFPFVAEGLCVAFLVKAGALLMARNGVTVRPLAEDALSLKTYLASRADNRSKAVSELVRTFMRKVSSLSKPRQLTLPMPA